MNQWAEFVKCYNHVKVLQQKLKQMQMQHEGEVKQKNLTIAAFHKQRPVGMALLYWTFSLFRFLRKAAEEIGTLVSETLDIF